jgi:hypothetical protein
MGECVDDCNMMRQHGGMRRRLQHGASKLCRHADNMLSTMLSTCYQHAINQPCYQHAINMLSTCLQFDVPASVRPPVSPKATAALAGSGQATMRLSPGLPTMSLKSSTRMAMPVSDLLKYLRRGYYVHADGYWERRSLQKVRQGTHWLRTWCTTSWRGDSPPLTSAGQRLKPSGPVGPVSIGAI